MNCVCPNMEYDQQLPSKNGTHDKLYNGFWDTLLSDKLDWYTSITMHNLCIFASGKKTAEDIWDTTNQPVYVPGRLPEGSS